MRNDSTEGSDRRSLSARATNLLGRLRQWAASMARTKFRTTGAVGQACADVARLTQQRRYDEAVALAERLLPEYSGDLAFVKQARTTFSKAGALTRHLEATRAQRLLADNPRIAAQEATALGRWRETSAQWRPEVVGDPERISPSTATGILHLLKVSVPYRQSGYTMRSKYTLEGQRAVGLNPVAMTALGFPRSVGVPDTLDVEDVEGIRHIRLDPGPDYDLEGPYDRYLHDYVAAAAKHVRQLAPAVIHVHSGFRGYDSALVGLALGRHFGIPVVYEVRGFFESLWTSDTQWSERSEIYRRRYNTENRCMADAAAVVTLSETMRAEIIARGVAPEKVVVVPNGVDVDAFKPRSRSTALVDRYGLSGKFVFGYVSNLDHYREGHETLIDAAVRLRHLGIDAVALIVGDGKRRGELERLAREKRVGDGVVFTGRVPHADVLDFYALMDVFVIPRVSERAARLVTPLKPFEAMAAGIPLVTSDLDALREITAEGDRGRYFHAGDAGSLATVLCDLQADAEGRARLADRARRWVVAERQWSANGCRYADLYAKLLSGKAPDVEFRCVDELTDG